MRGHEDDHHFLALRACAPLWDVYPHVVEKTAIGGDSPSKGSFGIHSDNLVVGILKEGIRRPSAQIKL
ncbi:hypothetical protein DdX_05152 [Ditylenchus destructor]|uniref:Uncharacterized protein n=1 Tax=Ditylenchus destructor TaxID=166010 RepID=A0AAD4N8U3_9BILA|nr:hypothetical protein DdX_05152 [Ditylenchus destructor]